MFVPGSVLASEPGVQVRGNEGKNKTWIAYEKQL